MVRLLMLLVFLAVLLAACGREQSQSAAPGIGRNGLQWVYGFLGYDDNGRRCITPRFAFKTFEEYCAALIDENRNQGCAREARRRTFDVTCR